MGVNAIVVTPPWSKQRKVSKASGSSKKSRINKTVPIKPHSKFNVDIMGLHGKWVVLSIIFSMRVLLSGWKFWATNRFPIVSGDTLKRIASWYTVTVVPVIKLLTKKHHRPPFAHRVFKVGVHAFGNTPNGLHIILLHNASKDIMAKCSEGVSSTTMTEVNRWFCLMSTTEGSSIFSIGPNYCTEQIPSWAFVTWL